MKKIVKVNLFIALGYTILLNSLSFLFSKGENRPLFVMFTFFPVALIHFMIAGICMAVHHFQSKAESRNAYIVVFGLIWVLVVLVMVFNG